MTYDFICNLGFIYNEYDGNGRKPPKYTKGEKQGKIPRLVARLRKWRPTVYRKQAGPTLGRTEALSLGAKKHRVGRGIGLSFLLSFIFTYNYP